MKSAIVFAYHNVGVRCLSVLLANKLDIKLVVTYEDDPQETIWFDSVKQLANDYDIPVICPADPNQSKIIHYIQSLQPDFIFSFYYRHLLSSALLNQAKQGCYNMHGSLLPKYRGRAPVNWALVHGEKESGATLHVMTDKPDQGDIVAQYAVPILPNDTAAQLMQKVTVAAELCLQEGIDLLLQGISLHRKQDLTQGSYFTGRTVEDGRIDWKTSAQNIHNLVRAVAPPYPGAFFDYHQYRFVILRTRVMPYNLLQKAGTIWYDQPTQHIYMSSLDGSVLRILASQINGNDLSYRNWHRFFSGTSLRLFDI